MTDDEFCERIGELAARAKRAAGVDPTAFDAIWREAKALAGDDEDRQQLLGAVALWSPTSADLP